MPSALLGIWYSKTIGGGEGRGAIRGKTGLALKGSQRCLPSGVDAECASLTFRSLILSCPSHFDSR